MLNVPPAPYPPHGPLGFVCGTTVDPLYRLEHEQADKRRASSRKTVLTRLTELVDSHAQDDYSANARLRQTMRSRKKKDREREEEAKVSNQYVANSAHVCGTKVDTDSKA